MEEIEDLGQRIYDIQQCLAFVVNGGRYDQETVMGLNAKMGRLEKALGEIEERVETQLACVAEIPDLIAEVKEFYLMCQEIPSPGPNDKSAVVLPLRAESRRPKNDDQEERTPETRRFPRRTSRPVTPT